MSYEGGFLEVRNLHNIPSKLSYELRLLFPPIKTSKYVAMTLINLNLCANVNIRCCFLRMNFSLNHFFLDGKFSSTYSFESDEGTKRKLVFMLSSTDVDCENYSRMKKNDNFSLPITDCNPFLIKKK
jgi:hypothetical protein